MRIDKFISDNLKADDLKDGPRLVTVAGVEVKKLGNEEKLVMSVEEFEQGIPLNKTALTVLAELCESTETDEWTGHQVVVYRDATVKYAGKKVGGIAFREPKAGTVKPAVTDDIPF